MDRFTALEIQDNYQDIEISSYHLNSNAKGEYGFMFTRLFEGENKVVWSSPPEYVSDVEAREKGAELLEEILENSFKFGEI